MLMALKRNQKGLTLIELLAVLVIVGIIAAIAIPAIGSTIANSKTKADNASIEMIKDAALRYVTAEEIATGVIPIADLVSKGYLVKTPDFNKITLGAITSTVNPGGAWVIDVATSAKP